MNIIYRGKDDTIQLRLGVDFREPGQRDPWEPKPDPTKGYDALMELAKDALKHGQGFARINPNDIFGNVGPLQQQAQASQQSHFGSPFNGIFGRMW